FGFTGAVSLTRLQNVGSVGLRSPEPKDTPMLQMNYLQNEADMQKLVEGIKLIRQVFQSSVFDEFRGEEIAPGVNVQSDAALEAYIRDTCSTVWHPIGTCKMG
ncbi:MAG: GMC oxidoreductase, partial [Nostoc sp.]